MDYTPPRGHASAVHEMDLSPLFSQLGFTSINETSLFVTLTEEQQTKIADALGPGQASDVLVRTVRGRNTKGDYLYESVTRESIQTLEPGKMLNDSVVNYFFKYTLNWIDKKLCSKDCTRGRSLFLTSFFLQNAFNEKSLTQQQGKFCYTTICKWIKVNVFDMEHIFVPYNYDQVHWGLAVIFVQKKCINWYDSLSWYEEGRMEGLLEFMEHEWIGYGYDVQYEPFKSSLWKLHKVKAPQQTGGKSQK